MKISHGIKDADMNVFTFYATIQLFRHETKTVLSKIIKKPGLTKSW